MTSKLDSNQNLRHARTGGELRVHGIRELSLSYEGSKEQIHIRPPNLSARGMFICTSHIFPEGAVLSLRFRLAYTDAEVQTRCEVRHCLPGVGIGVEFIGVTPEMERQIAREIAVETRGMQESVKLTARKKRTGKKRVTGKATRRKAPSRL